MLKPFEPYWCDIVVGITLIMHYIKAAYLVVLWSLLWLPHSLRNPRAFARWARRTFSAR